MATTLNNLALSMSFVESSAPFGANLNFLGTLIYPVAIHTVGFRSNMYVNAHFLLHLEMGFEKFNITAWSSYYLQSLFIKNKLQHGLF